MLKKDRPKIRVTQLEKFRRVMFGDYPFETEQDLIDNITNEFQGNEYTRIGTVFHSIVETGRPQCLKIAPEMRRYIKCKELRQMAVPEGRAFLEDGHMVQLDVNQCMIAYNYRQEMPHALHEIREWKEYGDALVTGCADIINGIRIRDIKTKYSYPSDKEYTDSMQWRYYMELFEMDIFDFDLFIFHGYEKDVHGYDVRGLQLERYEPAITCYRYPHLEQDCKNMVEEFLKWAKFRDLMPYLINQKIK